MALTKNPRALLAGLPLALALILTGCANNEPAAAPPVEIVDETPEPEEVVTEPDEVETEAPDPYGARWPLTGVGTDEVADRPAFIVKVGNDPTGRRSQEGLEYADVIYEVVVEGGITRLIAVFQSELPPRVMPVRSGRPTDIPIITPYGGVFVYSGAQGPFIQAINAAGNQSLTFDSGVGGSNLARADGRNDLHSVAAVPGPLLALANATRVSPPQGTMPFARDAESSTAGTDGAPVSTLTARMSNSQTSVFTWNASNGKFMRADSTQGSGQQLGAVNLIFIETFYGNTDVAGTSSVPNANLSPVNSSGQGVPGCETSVCTGRAVFAADGKYIEGTWQKGGPADPFTFLDADGQPVVFAPGNTFVQVVPTSGSWQLS